jgi:FtsH-binding integral membrane protein
MQVRTKRYEPVIARMSLKREIPEPIAQREDRNVRHPQSRRAILRKRILAVFLLVLCALILTMCVYYRSAYLRSAGDWSSFWVGEVIVGVWFVCGIVYVFRKIPKL